MAIVSDAFRLLIQSVFHDPKDPLNRKAKAHRIEEPRLRVQQQAHDLSKNGEDRIGTAGKVDVKHTSPSAGAGAMGCYC